MGKQKPSAKEKGKKVPKKSKKSSDEDWVATLAAKASAEGTSRETASSKAAAIERRLEKKRRRNDRLIAKAKEKEARRMARETGLDSRKRRQKRRDVPASSSKDVLAQEMEASGAVRRQENRRHRSGAPPRRTSSQCLSKLSAEIMQAAEGWNDHKRRVRPYIDPSSDPKRGKATKQRKYESSNIQPQKRDYGGLGLARPSLFLPLLDPSFIPKFEAEFEEHVHGFFGKQRTKAMKKQLDGDLLWRRLRPQKEKGGGATKGKKKSSEDSWKDKKVDGKKLSDMSPDDRVEAMIKLGLI